MGEPVGTGAAVGDDVGYSVSSVNVGDCVGDEVGTGAPEGAVVGTAVELDVG